MSVQNIIDNPLLFRGYRIVSDPLLTESKVVPIQQNWFMRIVAKIFRMKTSTVVGVPSNSVYLVHDVIIAHPEMVIKIKDALEKEKCQ
ncbi:hypothetical protein HOU08_gp187 [Dickeya phage vB_DsoM_JA29]|uniref:Uncharacterized protein n=1 Tax=Dickeya phage vB_DsoM_JA29 TaxID=2283031 RepID=A0A384ZXB6_9CAUD|nr:hypothetical protein HOU08_gp187 [Dickeya phage vB_DsoM_JA29]AXG66913.1 hypothetical protein JA29_187 [Dickeya phage vB_DsoM_JA29]